MTKNKFSYKKMVEKIAKYLVIFIIPMAIDWFIVNYPEWAQLSIAGALVGVSNYLKVKVGMKLP